MRVLLQRRLLPGIRHLGQRKDLRKRGSGADLGQAQGVGAYLAHYAGRQLAQVEGYYYFGRLAQGWLFGERNYWRCRAGTLLHGPVAHGVGQEIRHGVGRGKRHVVVGLRLRGEPPQQAAVYLPHQRGVAQHPNVVGQLFAGQRLLAGAVAGVKIAPEFRRVGKYRHRQLGGLHGIEGIFNKGLNSPGILDILRSKDEVRDEDAHGTGLLGLQR